MKLNFCSLKRIIFVDLKINKILHKTCHVIFIQDVQIKQSITVTDVSFCITMSLNSNLITMSRVWYNFTTNSLIQSELNGNNSSMDPEGGGGGPDPPPPPLRFVRGGVLCRGLVSTCRRGGPEVVFNLLLSIFFSGSLRSPVLYKRITYIHTSKFNIQYGTVILSQYFLYPNYEKNPTSHPLLHETVLFSRIARFYTI